MRILFADQFSEMGGAQHCLLDVLAAVRERGWQARVAVPGAGPLIERARALGCEVSPIPCGPFRHGRKSAADGVRFTAQCAAQVAALSRLARDADLVYVNGPRLLPAGALVARGRIPLLFHCHSRIPGGVSMWLARRALRLARASLVASCRYVAEPLTSKFQVVYNGVAGPAAVPERSRADAWRIGVIGRIGPEKGQAEFLRAARLLTGCRFVVCGAPLFGDPAYARRVHRLAEGLPVEFPGWQPDVSPVLAALDLLVVPSGPGEATSRVILEAFAAGVPVVAFASGGIPEIVADGRTGFLVAPATPEALAACLRGLLAVPQRLSDVAAAARLRWSESFTVGRFRREMISAIEAAAGTAGPHTPPRTPPHTARAGSRSG